MNFVYFIYDRLHFKAMSQSFKYSNSIVESTKYMQWDTLSVRFLAHIVWQDSAYDWPANKNIQIFIKVLD